MKRHKTWLVVAVLSLLGTLWYRQMETEVDRLWDALVDLEEVIGVER